MSDLRVTGTHFLDASDGPADRLRINGTAGTRNYYNPAGPNSGLTEPGATVLDWSNTKIDINDPGLNSSTITDVLVDDVDADYSVAFDVNPDLDVPTLTVTYDDILDRLVVQSDFPIFANDGAPNFIWADIDGTNTNAAVGLTYVSDTEAYSPNAIAGLNGPTTITQVKVGRSPLYANNDIVGHWVGSVLVAAPALSGYTILSANGLGTNRGGVHIAKDNAGGYLVAGEGTFGGDTRGVWRFDTNGDLDLSWAGGDGIYSIPSGTAYDQSVAVAATNDGGSLVGGGSQIHRLDASGVINGSFGVAGVLSIPGATIAPKGLFAEAGGTFLVIWNTGPFGTGVVQRYDSTGALLKTVNLTFTARQAAALGAVNQYAVVGEVGGTGDAFVAIVDIDAETAFNSNIASEGIRSTSDGYMGVAVAPGDTAVYVAGTDDATQLLPYILKYDLPSLAQDIGFGLVTDMPPEATEAQWNDVAVASGGDIIASGHGDYGQYAITGRFTSAGVPVPSYGGDGFTAEQLGPNPDDMFYETFVDGPEAIHTGYSQDGGTAYAFIYRRIVATGLPDTTFGQP